MADNTIFLDPASAITLRFEANYTGSLPLVWDNDDGVAEDLTAGFIQVSVDFVTANFAAINGPNPLIRANGAANFDILTLINEGPGDGLSEAGLVAEIFRGQEFSNMIFFAPVILTTQRVQRPQGEFFSTPLTCPFEQDVKVTIA